MILNAKNKTDVNMTELEVHIDAESLEKAVAATYQREKKNISMPGFRKGHVPRKLFEKTYGENVFYEDAINSIINKEMFDVIEEAELNIVDQPRVELTKVDKAEGADLKISCITYPVITVADYKGIEAVKSVKEITDEDVNKELESMRVRNARVVSVDDRAAEMGDEVTLDFEGFFGDEAFEGGKGENYQLKLGSKQFIPGFEEQVAGHKIDEAFDVVVTFPTDYQMEDYAGKEATFKCLIHSISKEELPEIDDEFVKDTSEFDTVDELKADVRAKLEKSAASQADNAFENQLCESVIAKVVDPIPHCMFERHADRLMDQFSRQLQQSGMDMDLYLQYTGMTRDQMKDTYLNRAENEIKLRLGLEAIANAESLTPSDEKIDEEVAKIAEQVNMPAENVKNMIDMDSLTTDLKVSMALDFVKENAVVKEAAPAEETTEA